MRNIKKWITVFGAVALIGTNVMGVCAAPFDANWYATQNPDVVAVIGNDAAALEQHYNTFGKAEGRTANATSDSTVTNSGTAMSAVFDAAYYAAMNPDVVAVYGTDAMSLYTHYISVGINEGRSGSATFNAAAYKAANPDLATAFGDDLAAYVNHYATVGQAEGRSAGASGVESNSKGKDSESSDPYARFKSSGSSSSHKSSSSSSEKDSSDDDDDEVTEEKKFEYTIKGISGPDTIKTGESAEYMLNYSASGIPEGCKLYVSVEDYNRVTGVEVDYSDDTDNWMRVDVADNADTEEALTIWGIFILYDEDSEDMEEDYLIRKDIYKDVTIVASDAEEELETEESVTEVPETEEPVTEEPETEVPETEETETEETVIE